MTNTPIIYCMLLQMVAFGHKKNIFSQGLAPFSLAQQLAE